MSALDALLHFVNFVLPAVLLGGIAAGLVKLAWFRALKAVTWVRLAGCASAAAAVALIGGMILTGRDGAMSTYGAMVLASAAALGWVGWSKR